MSKPKITTTVRATVTVDIEVGRWSGNSDFAGLHQQVSREAKQTLHNVLGRDAKIVGEPKIQFVTHEEK